MCVTLNGFLIADNKHRVLSALLGMTVTGLLLMVVLAAWLYKVFVIQPSR